MSETLTTRRDSKATLAAARKAMFKNMGLGEVNGPILLDDAETSAALKDFSFDPEMGISEERIGDHLSEVAVEVYNDEASGLPAAVDYVLPAESGKFHVTRFFNPGSPEEFDPQVALVR